MGEAGGLTKEIGRQVVLHGQWQATYGSQADKD